MSVGEKIDLFHLSEYDDNGDGYLTIDDDIVASLGILMPASPDAPSYLRAFRPSDAIDVMTGANADGQFVEVGATEEFYNVVNIGPSVAAYAAQVSYLGSREQQVKLVAPVDQGGGGALIAG
ncbi:hypothetical protein [Caulobacter segnis]|uniref:hypothetical protein n=1 Tax=Caulobacter segnis TaxID=88688 RepID=UPI0026F05CD2|nr:hypothetical protein [Caulobacter segnis]